MTTMTTESIAKIQANLDAIAASGFGVHFCCKTKEAAIKFAHGAMTEKGNPFYGDDIEINGREIVVAPKGNITVDIREIAELFCSEFSKQTGIKVIDFTETVHWN